MRPHHPSPSRYRVVLHSLCSGAVATLCVGHAAAQVTPAVSQLVAPVPQSVLPAKPQLVAPSSVILPSSAATRRPAAFALSSDAFFADQPTGLPSASRVQALYATSDVAVATAMFRSLQVRAPAGVRGTNPTATTKVTIVLSVSPTAHRQAASSFGANHGPNPAQVFQGQVSLPARSTQGTWPAPWENAIPFAQPWAFSRSGGASLVVELAQSGNTGGAPWLIEAVQRDVGGRSDNGTPNCPFAGTTSVSWGLVARTPFVGGSWSLRYQQLPGGIAGVGALGEQGSGGTWAGRTLPIELGFLGAPGCTWNVAPSVLLPMVANAAGEATWPTVPIPNDRSLAGKSFFDHSVWLDARANAAGLVTGWSSKWTIGDDQPVPGAMVTAVGSATAAAGTVSPEQVPTLRLHE